jgi:hypothetical protein
LDLVDKLNEDPKFPKIKKNDWGRKNIVKKERPILSGDFEKIKSGVKIEQ